MTDFTSTENPYYLSFELAAGDPFVFNNNIPINDIEAPQATPPGDTTVVCGSDIPPVPVVTFTDNCGDFIMSYNEVLMADSSVDERLLIRNWIATDAAGNSDTITQTVIINDNIAPTIDMTGISDATVDCGSDIPAVPTPAITDNCDEVTVDFSEVIVTDSSTDEQQLLRTWVATDAAGNESTETQTITINDNEAPAISMAGISDETVDCGSDIPAVPAPVITDNCDEVVVDFSEVTVTDSSTDEQVLVRMWVATDMAGNQSTETQTITINDNEAPAIDMAGITDETVDCGSDIPTVPTPAITDNCDEVFVDFSEVTVTDSSTDEQQLLRTWVATDAAGNESTETQTITINDNEAPSIDMTGITDETVDCGSDIPAVPAPTITDNCDEVVVDFSEVAVTDSSADEQQLLRTWVATDAAGNESIETQTITINDNEAPAIDMTGISDATVDCGSDIPAVPTPAITDNCDEVTVDFSEVIVTDSSTDEQQLLRTWVATDAAGNESTETQTITINDNEAPAISMAGISDETVDCGSDIPAVPAPVITDNCDEVVVDFSEVTVTDSSTDEQVLVRMWVATDMAGNQSTETQTITINDNEAPAIDMAGITDETVDCGSDIPTVPTPAITDNCDEVTVDFSEVIVTDSSTDEQQLLRTWVATDAAGNESTETQTITINDNEAPSIDMTGITDETVDCGSDIPAVPAPTITDNCDEVVVDFSEVAVTDSSADEQQLLRTWVATDAAGNESIETQTITINDNEAPAIDMTGISDATVDCGSDIPAVPTPAVTDNCDEVFVDFSEVTVTDSSTDEQQLLRTWVATDAAGNQSVEKQTITINDNEAPAIDMTGISDETVDCGSDIPAVPAPVITDNCDEVVVDFSEMTVTDSSADEQQLLRTWTATDAAGNESIETQTITINDNEAPAIDMTGISDATVDCGSDIPAVPTPAVTDNCDEVTVDFSEVTVTDSSTDEQQLLRTWVATDAAGNQSVETQTITINDNEAPAIDMTGISDETVDCGSDIPTVPTPTITDNCDEVTVDFSEVTMTDSSTDEQVLVRTWTAVDAAGNESVETQTITINDNEAPAIDMAGISDETVDCGSDIPTVPTPAITDNCDEVTVDFSEVIVTDSSTDEQQLLRTWVATDAAGNESTETQTITINDNEAPAIDMTGISDATVDCGSDIPAVPTPAVTDNCDEVTVDFSEVAVTDSSTDEQQLLRTWVATDAAGNQSVETQTITINDNEAPAIDMTGISDATVDCGSDIPAVPTPAVTDNCDEVFVDFSEVTVTDSSTDEQQLLRTWVATDAAGNQSVEKQTITINDNEAPAIDMSGISDETVDCGSDIPAVPTPAITDNCDEVTVDFSEVIVTDSSTDEQVLLRAWTATDAAGNESTETQTITINDNEAPSIDMAGIGDETVDCGSDIPAVPAPAITDNCDEVTVDFSEITMTDSSTDEQVLIRTWVATDAAGNQSSETQTITINDNEAPAIDMTGISDATVDCGSDIPAVPAPVITDNCDEVTVDFSEIIVTDSSTDEQQLLRTWTVTDAAGNQSVETQTITINDNEAPAIDMTGISDATVDCGSDIPAVPTPAVTDNCDEVVVDFSEVAVTDSSTDEQQLLRTWVATDAAGNQSVETQTITINDNEAPAIDMTGISDATVDCGSDIPAVPTPTITDNCDEVTVDFSEVLVYDSSADEQQLLRTWTATDAAGNQSVGTQIITIIDNEAPQVVLAPTDESVECGSDIPFIPLVDFTDNCDEFTVDMSEVIVTDSSADEQQLLRTWVATDEAGNGTVITQIITINDNEAPQVVTAPTDQTVDCGSDIPAMPTVDFTDNCDEFTVDMSEVIVTDSSADEQQLLRAWVATDEAGNGTTIVQVITINDTEAPQVVAAPSDETVDCGSDIPAVPVVDFTDNCDEIVVDFSETLSDNGSVDESTLTRTWVAVDEAGNKTTIVQVITINDTEAPQVVAAPSDETVDCGSDIPAVPVVDFTDNCDEIVVDFSETLSDNGSVDQSTLTRTWVATDAAGNETIISQTITIIDTEAPQVVTAPVDMALDCGSEIPSVPVVEFTDNCDEVMVDYSESLTDNGSVDEMTLTRTWVVLDAAGNETVVSQTITIIDSEAPQVVSAPSDMTVECGKDIPSLPAVNFTDNCDEINVDFSEVLSDNSSVDESTLTRTWVAVDAAGNETTIAQIITINDTEAPQVVAAPSDETVDCGSDIPAVPTVDFTDNCNEVIIDFSETLSDNGSVDESTLTRMWVAVDVAGNETVITQIITIIDTEAPQVVTAPVDETVDCGSDIPAVPTVDFTDNCNEVIIDFSETLSDNGSVDESTLTRTWVATDAAGNETVITQIITIIDTEAPQVVVAPVDETVACGSDIPAVPTVDFMDTCDEMTVDFSETLSNNGSADEATLTRIWVAVDAAGNETVFTQIITIIDDEAPQVVTAPVDEMVECADDIPVVPIVDFTDNCDEVMVGFSEIFSTNGSLNASTIIRTWVAVDAAGNETVIQQEVTIMDTEAPHVVTAPIDEMVACGSDIPAVPTVEFTDNCDEMAIDFSETLSDNGSVDEAVLTRTWVATDVAGNQSIIVQIITINDIEAPQVVVAPIDEMVVCGSDIPAVPTVEFTDNCEEVTVDFSETLSNNGSVDESTVTRTWVATDAAGNETIMIQIITIIDDEAPQVVTAPMDETVACGSDIPAVPSVEFIDNCDEVTVDFSETLSNNGSVDEATLTRSWIALDAAGNETVITQIITIIDNEAPQVVSVPSDEMVACGSDIPAVPSVEFIDNCDEVTVDFSETLSNNGSVDEATLTRSWIALDAAGNETVITQIITIIDNEAPQVVARSSK